MVLPFDTKLDLSGHIGKPLSAHRKKFQSSCPLLLLPLLFPILLALNGNQLWELYMSPSLPPYGMGPRRMRCLCTSTLVPMLGKWTAGKYNKFYCQAQLSSLKPQLKLNFSSISSFPPPTPHHCWESSKLRDDLRKKKLYKGWHRAYFNLHPPS